MLPDESASFGPQAQVELLLQDYGLNADGWASDFFESDSERLQMAMLMEIRGETLIESAQQESETSGNPTKEETTESGLNNDAMLRLGQGTNNVDLGWNVTGSGTIEIQVSFDRSRWFTFDEIPVEAGEGVEQYETTYPYTRVFGKSDLDGDVNRLQIVAGPGN
ncbi:hypothetical protein [Halostella sp. PRR32]|uniref:hypothetical protein n=1 Tax=Halostella sp. PRR32 TaxID=3098147 RepID=UPI002B1E1D2F|nr:hypothetical protein [Halostella sp. PRR32]